MITCTVHCAMSSMSCVTITRFSRRLYQYYLRIQVICSTQYHEVFFTSITKHRRRRQHRLKLSTPKNKPPLHRKRTAKWKKIDEFRKASLTRTRSRIDLTRTRKVSVRRCVGERRCCEADATVGCIEDRVEAFKESIAVDEGYIFVQDRTQLRQV